MNVQADVGDVVEMLGGGQPDDFADGALGIMAAQTGEGFEADFFLLGQLSDVIECGAFGFGENRAGAVVRERVEFGLVHGFLDGEGAADVHAEEADVDARDLLANEDLGFAGQFEFFVEPADFRGEEGPLSVASRPCRIGGA